MAELVGLLNRILAGQYRVSAEVGRGGMATVYRAEDLRHDRTVAIKVLLPELAAVVGAERFLREIQIDARLRHPNVLPLLDSGAVEGLPFFVMPFVHGPSLEERLSREKQLPVADVTGIGVEVADALDYAHARGLVHRDIKPGNIMIEGGHAVVTDFGIAIAIRGADAQRLTVSGVSPGSPVYMSPEQAAGEDHLDGRSDIYSLACVLYEALAGDPPFMGRIPQAILAKKLSEPPPSLRVVRDSVPEALEWAIRKGLARSPADRFRTASEFRDTLAVIAEGKHVDIEADSTPDVVRPPGNARSRSLPREARTGNRLATGLIWSVAALALVTAVGFVTNRAYDLALEIPLAYTPSRSDFLVLGLQALIPELIFGFLALLAWVVLRYTGRAVGWLLHRNRRVGATVDSTRSTVLGAWRRARGRLEPTTIADLYFLAAVAAGLLVLIPFRDFLAAVVFVDAGTLGSRPLQRGWFIAMPVLIVTLVVTWRLVFDYLRRHGTLAGRVALSRWGSLAWIAVLLLISALPWRLVGGSDAERVLFQGERAYVLLENEREVVIYRPESGVTGVHSKDEGLDLKRSGVLGYPFESAAAFERGEPST